MNEIESHILKADDATILKNYSLNQHTYRTILNRHFYSQSNTRSLVAVSLKLPSSVSQKKFINIVGTENVKKELSDYVDPYTKFLTLAISFLIIFLISTAYLIDLYFHELQLQ